MKSNLGKFVALALGLGLATESFAEEWNVSTWGKRRAFTEHIEKLAELVVEKISPISIEINKLQKDTFSLNKDKK